MLLKFKNEQIYYTLEPLWNSIGFDFKFKTQISNLVIANSQNDFIQDVEISKELLIQVYGAASRQPEGPAAAINKEIKLALLPQLEAVSNMNEVINNQAEPNEAASIQLAINDLDLADAAARAALIAKGKEKVLNLK